MSDWREKQRAGMLQTIKEQRGKVAERRGTAKKEFDVKGLQRADEDERGLDEMERRVKEDWKDFEPPPGKKPIEE